MLVPAITFAYVAACCVEERGQCSVYCSKYLFHMLAGCLGAIRQPRHGIEQVCAPCGPETVQREHAATRNEQVFRRSPFRTPSFHDLHMLCLTEPNIFRQDRQRKRRYTNAPKPTPWSSHGKTGTHVSIRKWEPRQCDDEATTNEHTSKPRCPDVQHGFHQRACK